MTLSPAIALAAVERRTTPCWPLDDAGALVDWLVVEGREPEPEPEEIVDLRTVPDELLEVELLAGRPAEEILRATPIPPTARAGGATDGADSRGGGGVSCWTMPAWRWAPSTGAFDVERAASWEVAMGGAGRSVEDGDRSVGERRMSCATASACRSSAES